MVKLSDVAAAANVSVTTASMVLNPGKQVCRVSAACAERIRQAAMRLGYVGNYHARAMQLGRAETLGLAFDTGDVGMDLSDREGLGGAYFNHLIGGVEATTHFAGYNLTIIGPGKKQRATEIGATQIMQRRLDGLVVAAVLSSVRATKLIVEQPKLPVVLIEYEDDSQFPVVHYDEAAGVAEAVNHLAELGHRDLLWLGPDNPGPLKREQLFIRHVWDKGLRGSSCRFKEGHAPRGKDGTADSAHAALAKHIKENNPFTAVMAYNDSTAIGAYGAIMEAGLKIPQDVSVVGFDDFYACHVYPRMTTVSHQVFEMGRRAGELALQMAGNPEAVEKLRGYRELIKLNLIVRESSGPAPVKK